jgi:hypothetical protein
MIIMLYVFLGIAIFYVGMGLLGLGKLFKFYKKKKQSNIIFLEEYKKNRRKKI